MKFTAEKLEGNKAKLTIEVPEENFDKSMEKAYKGIIGRLNVPGFRKGKAPRHIVERMYGREMFLDDAVKDAIPAAFSEVMDQAGAEYECMVYPKYEVVSTEKGEGLVFTAEYDLKPVVTLGEYKGLELEKISGEPEEGAVEKQIKAMQERFARLEKIEGAAEKGDVCTIDFVGKVDDTAFEGGTGSNHPLELGSGSFIPGFEDQLLGSKAGDEIKVDVTFPEDYGAKELAGKAAVFDVTVTEVKRKVLAELNDDFAQDVSECQTMEELRTELTEKLSAQAKEKAKAEMETQALEKALAVCQVTVPDSMVDVRLDQLLDNFIRQISRQGIGFEQYLQLTGNTAEKVRDNFRERAVTELKTELVLEAIADAEGIVADDEALEAEYARLAEQTQKTPEEIKEIYGANSAMVDSLKFNVKVTGAIKILMDNAKIK
ncbi:MAG: trigger factor [Peptococcaceae bacterium]|nr:trigger factor [Peptococcaceae bacterium]